MVIEQKKRMSIEIQVRITRNQSFSDFSKTQGEVAQLLDFH